MRTLHIILILLLGLLVFNCTRQLYVETGVLWTDDQYFNTTGDWYIALSEGCYSNGEGAKLNVIDQLPLTPGRNSVERFIVDSGTAEDITAFVYLDVNQNGQYDDGYDKITGYKFNYSTVNTTTPIAVPAFF